MNSMTINTYNLQENNMKKILFFTAILLSTSVLQAEETSWKEVGDSISETSGKAWQATKESSGDAWDATKETSGEAWDATKETSGEAWDATKETSGEAREATKDYSSETWDKGKKAVTK